MYRYPKWMCDERIGAVGGILGKMRPHLGKMRPILAICMKSGQKCSRIGEGGGGSIMALPQVHLLASGFLIRESFWIQPFVDDMASPGHEP